MSAGDIWGEQGLWTFIVSLDSALYPKKTPKNIIDFHIQKFKRSKNFKFCDYFFLFCLVYKKDLIGLRRIRATQGHTLEVL